MPRAKLIRFSCPSSHDAYLAALRVVYGAPVEPTRCVLHPASTLTSTPIMPLLQELAEHWGDWFSRPLHAFFHHCTPGAWGAATVSDGPPTQQQPVWHEDSLLVRNLEELQECRNRNLRVHVLATQYWHPVLEDLVHRGLVDVHDE